MHKRISRHQVRLGMFIETIEGEWLSHPFWTRRFVLRDYEDLLKLRASDVRAVVIDESKGVRAPEPVAPAKPVQPIPLVGPPSAPSAVRRKPETLWAERELHHCRRAVGQLFADARLGRGISMTRCEGIVNGIADALSRNAEALLTITRLKSIDAYTHLHSISVSALMIHFGRHLGLRDEEIALLGQAGLLHDVGKMQLSTALLNKTGLLNPTELEAVRDHPRAGHAILLQQGKVPGTVLDVCLQHHEHMDGSGYPQGLSAGDLGTAVRIATICDVYDAVTSLRPYKKPWRPQEALRYMSRRQGHFDQDLLRAFIDCVGFDATLLDGSAESDPPSPVVNSYSDPIAS